VNIGGAVVCTATSQLQKDSTRSRTKPVQIKAAVASKDPRRQLEPREPRKPTILSSKTPRVRLIVMKGPLQPRKLLTACGAGTNHGDLLAEAARKLAQGDGNKQSILCNVAMEDSQ